MNLYKLTLNTLSALIVTTSVSLFSTISLADGHKVLDKIHFLIPGGAGGGLGWGDDEHRVNRENRSECSPNIYECMASTNCFLVEKKYCCTEFLGGNSRGCCVAGTTKVKVRTILKRGFGVSSRRVGSLRKKSWK